MTLEEFRDKVISLKDEELLKLPFTLSEPSLSYKIERTGITAAYEFVLEQLEGWKKTGEHVPKVLKNNARFFEDIAGRLTRFLSTFDWQYDKSSIGSLWENRIQHIINERHSTIFLYDLPETRFLLELHKTFSDAVDGSHGFFTDTIQSNELDNSVYFTGIMLAYEFRKKQHQPLTGQQFPEETSLQHYRNRIGKYIEESEQHLRKYISDTTNQCNERLTEIDKSRHKDKEGYQNWFSQAQNNFSNFQADALKQVAELEMTYAQVLKLKKPADYWKQRADTLKKEGWRAVYGIIGLVLFACLTLYFLLWQTPEGMLLSFFNGNASAIKWSVVYVTFITFLAYIIRAVHKIAFSSFHLARDSEEREQLTYVYLALIKDAAVEEKDKHLILQSLFSRADTGLLKDESAPTMPGSMIDNVMRK